MREGTPQLTTWVKIGADNTVTVIVPHCEMGTGVHTALAMMCAEELEADWSQVRVEEAPGTDDYANGYLVRIFVPDRRSPCRSSWSAASTSASFKLTQMHGSAGDRRQQRRARHGSSRHARRRRSREVMLIEAAAKQWNVPAAECEREALESHACRIGPHAHVRRARAPRRRCSNRRCIRRSSRATTTRSSARRRRASTSRRRSTARRPTAST